MTEDYNDADDPFEDEIEADEPIEAVSEDGTFSFDDEYNGDPWEDSQGDLHELYQGWPELEGVEERTHFDTYEEAVNYINEILTTADQYFEVYEYDDEYYVFYMGGSE